MVEATPALSLPAGILHPDAGRVMLGYRETHAMHVRTRR